MDEQFKYLKIVATGDWHLGSPRLVSENFYNELKKILYPELKDAHLLILTGDIYDQLLTVSSKAHKYAARILKDLLVFSARTGMQIRLLHGTYSHDRDQLDVFKALEVPGSRFAVVKEIFCEELKDFRNGFSEPDVKLRVGYLPDNLPYKNSTDAVEHLKRNMTVLGWTDLDMVVCHGAFEHVIPEDSSHTPPCLYSLDQFDNILHGPMILGHIHTPGRFKNAYYCGSFERLSHGEEEDKGFYVFTREVESRNSWHARFIRNPHATAFITIIPQGNDIPAITQNYIDQVDEKFPVRRGYVRVLQSNPEVRAILHKVTSTNFPEISYSSRSTGDKENISLQITDITLETFDDVRPNKNNLGGLVYQFLEEHQILGDLTKESVVEHVEKLFEIER